MMWGVTGGDEGAAVGRERKPGTPCPSGHGSKLWQGEGFQGW